MKKYIVKLINFGLTIMLSILLIFCMTPTKAFAATAESNSGSKTATPLNSFNPKIDKSLITGILTDMGIWKDLPCIVQWFASLFIDQLLLPALYPQEEAGPSEEMQMLNIISEKQDTIINQLNNFGIQLQSTEFNNIFNNFIINNQGSYYLKLGSQTLNEIDKKYAEYFNGTKEMTDEIKDQITEERKTAVLKGIGVKDYQSASETIDTTTSNMAKLITIQYGTTRGFFSLLAAKRELMRMTTYWEHEATEELDDFNNNVVSEFIGLATLDILSVNARIEWCKENNAPYTSLETRLHQIKDEICMVTEEYYKCSHTLDDSYRHFWYNGADLYFKVEANEDFTLPREEGIQDGAQRVDVRDWNHTQGLTGDYPTNGKLRETSTTNIWAGIKANNAITSDMANSMLDSTNHLVSIQDIIKRGNFKFRNIDFDDTSKTPVMLFDAQDTNNPFAFDVVKTSKQGIGTVEDTYTYTPSPRGVKLDQKAHVNKDEAYKIPTYKYEGIVYTCYVSSSTLFYVYDNRDKSQNYFTLTPVPKAQVVTTPDANSGSITPQDNYTFDIGTKVTSQSNRLFFYNSNGDIIGQQTAMPRAGFTFAYWGSSDQSLVVGDNQIDGVIKGDTGFKAYFKKGFSANVYSSNDGTFKVDDSALNYTNESVDLNNSNNVQYCIQNDQLHLKWTNDGVSHERKFTPNNTYSMHLVSWNIQDTDVVADGTWHVIDSTVIASNNQLNIVANFSENTNKVVDLHFTSNNTKLGGFLVVPNRIDDIDMQINAKDGIINFELTVNALDENLIYIRYTDGLTGEEKEKYVISYRNPSSGHYSSTYVERWLNLDTKATFMDYDNTIYTYKAQNSHEAMNIQCVFMVRE